MVPWRCCARPHAVGAWVTHPLKPATSGTAPNQLVEEQPPGDESVAIVDPLVGLVMMQVRTMMCTAAVIPCHLYLTHMISLL